MYEIYELFFIWITIFLLSFFAYTKIAMKVYNKKLKKLNDMTKTMTDDLVDRVGKLEETVSQMRVEFAGLKATIKTWGLIIGFIFSTMTTYVIAVNVQKGNQTKTEKQTRQ